MSTTVLRSRVIAPIIVVALVAMHQLFLNVVVTRPAPDWRVPVEVTVYGLTGIAASLIALTGLGRAFAPRERAEAELRAAFDELEFNHQKLLVLHDLGERVAAAADQQSVIELAAHLAFVSRTAIQLGQHKLVVPQNLRRCQATIDRALQHRQRRVGGLIEIHFHPQNSSQVNVNVL